MIHYQTLEPVRNDDLQILSRIRSKFNEDRNFWERLKLWRKSDILEGLEPSEARWGFTRPRDDGDRLRIVTAIKEMSRVLETTSKPIGAWYCPVFSSPM